MIVFLPININQFIFKPVKVKVPCGLLVVGAVIVRDSMFLGLGI